MIKLYGTTISNYFSTVKAAFIEKGVAFEEVTVFPSQDPAILAASPMGKVPYIESDGQALSETNVIFDYLEEIQPEPALYPKDIWARAKCKELIRTVELYLDQPARKHIASIYFGAPVDETLLEPVKAELDKGVAALKQLAKFDPYIAGPDFSYADIAAYFQINFANLHSKTIYDWDICTSVPGLKEYLTLAGERPSIRSVDDTLQRDFAAFINKS